MSRKRIIESDDNIESILFNGLQQNSPAKSDFKKNINFSSRNNELSLVGKHLSKYTMEVNNSSFYS